MCRKTKHSWSTINSEHQVDRRSVSLRSNLTWLAMEKRDLSISLTCGRIDLWLKWFNPQEGTVPHSSKSCCGWGLRKRISVLPTGHTSRMSVTYLALGRARSECGRLRWSLDSTRRAILSSSLLSWRCSLRCSATMRSCTRVWSLCVRVTLILVVDRPPTLSSSSVSSVPHSSSVNVSSAVTKNVLNQKWNIFS